MSVAKNPREIARDSLLRSSHWLWRRLPPALSEGWGSRNQEKARLEIGKTVFIGKKTASSTTQNAIHKRKKKPTCDDNHKSASCGGGGNRTRVPQHLHAGFYVCSRMISAFAILAPNRRGGKTASRERFLISGVPHVDPKRSGIVAGSRTSPAKVLSRGNLSLGGHCEIRLGN